MPGSSMFSFYFVAGIFIFLVITILAKGIVIVQQATVRIIERLGKYHRTLESGINLIIPFLDQIRLIQANQMRTDFQGRSYMVRERVNFVDLREKVYDFPRQNVITKDNVTLEINAILYFQITDAFKALYEIEDLITAIEKLTQTTLRNVIGELDLDGTLTSRDTINSKLRIILDEATDKWGVKVTRVELQDINPPKDIREAMEKQMRAEREKRQRILIAEGEKKAAVLQAEGERDKLIAEAEGSRQKQILEATGEAEAKIRVAEAEAKVISLIKKEVDKHDPTQYLIAIKYVEALKSIAGQNGEKVIFMPYESSSILGSLASIKELFKEKDKN